MDDDFDYGFIGDEEKLKKISNILFENHSPDDLLKLLEKSIQQDAENIRKDMVITPDDHIGSLVVEINWDVPGN